MIHYGLLSGQPITGQLLEAAGSKATVRLFRLLDWVHDVQRATLHATMAEMFEAVRSGLTNSEVAGHYPLAAFQDALAHNDVNGRRGKVILHL